MRRILATVLAASMGAGIMACNASASTVIVSPVDAIASTTNGINDLDIGNTIDHSGLTIDFINGVTDFDSYIALDPYHSSAAAGNEWFSRSYPSLTYTHQTLWFDLGSIMQVDRLAFWNEEFAGISGFEMSYSTDNVTFTDIGHFTTTNNPGATGTAGATQPYWYLPDVLTFSQVDMRYFSIYTDTCPAAGSLGYWGCSLGEIAVGAQSASTVPVPAALPLVISGIGALGLVGWRRRRRPAA
ncbi:MAG: VPLPA-CTERM sorting domain-containing protein [Salaquimonas sp.]|jgi:hypothetical protein|nr:VPLPA-CTERM sorting domain-containing protein [Salaquimonas sp.]